MSVRLTMEEKHELTVYGWMRENLQTNMDMKYIISIIYEYYMISIDSNILSVKEQVALMNLLYDKLKGFKKFKHIQAINAQLLFRASEHHYQANKFHEFCDNRGPTVTIIHNDEDHVFGGYTSKSWKDRGNDTTDPTAFLWSVRPNVKTFGFKEGFERGHDAVVHYEGGPSFGAACDIWISFYEKYPSNHWLSKLDSGYNGCDPYIFNFEAQDFCGEDIDDYNYHNELDESTDGVYYSDDGYTFDICDYEVFSISFE